MELPKNILVLLGPAGSFSDIAAEKLGAGWGKKYVSSFTKLFALLKKKNMYGFVPIKNKIAGKIKESLFYLKGRKFLILKKVCISVNFVLAAKKNIKLSEIKKVYCPEVVKKQCEKFIGRNLPQANFAHNCNSSSSAIKKVVQQKGFSAAAIGSVYGAKLYGLTILARNVQDDPKDWTEFWLVKFS